MKNLKKIVRSFPISKDCEVEVSPREEGFQGSWFRAILEQDPAKVKGEKLRVRYTILFKEGGEKPCREYIERCFIRPVPPECLNEGVEFKEGSEVAAYYSEGWWNGVIVVEEEDGSFLVYFDDPSDILKFDKSQLRPDAHWTGFKWVTKKTRPSPPRDLFAKYELQDIVEVFVGNGWRKGEVKEILLDDKYKVSFKDTEERMKQETENQTQDEAEQQVEPDVEVEDSVQLQRKKRERVNKNAQRELGDAENLLSYMIAQKQQNTKEQSQDEDDVEVDDGDKERETSKSIEGADASTSKSKRQKLPAAEVSVDDVIGNILEDLILKSQTHEGKEQQENKKDKADAKVEKPVQVRNIKRGRGKKAQEEEEEEQDQADAEVEKPVGVVNAQEKCSFEFRKSAVTVTYKSKKQKTQDGKDSTDEPK
ncbi:hypothetical protein Bca52824_001108 [Brassica carinata]|uniref:Agenet domain-containing protein n=1 Tax=Brassica carinata TaxID=52824 RepID=A0A8X7WFG3_BRACI|nr:hypothetical protein Bca52824_001108 [Brassica carinata]